MSGMDNKNLIIAIAVSIVILLGFELFIQRPNAELKQAQIAAQQAEEAKKAESNPTPAAAPAGTVPGTAAATTTVMPRAQALTQAPRVRISTPSLHGSISLEGGRLDDLSLVKYRETVDPASPEIVLLSPNGAEHPYKAEFGWSLAQGATAKLPDGDTRWTTSADELTVGHPVDLSWDNGEGLKFVRTYAVDENFMFTVTQRVENKSSTPVSLLPYGLINRTGTPEVLGYYLLHEGLIGIFDGKEKDIKYADLKPADGKPNEVIETPTTGGWLGITDKYWLTALIPDQKEMVKTHFQKTEAGKIERYQADFLGPEHVADAGGSTESTIRFFAGAKEVKLLTGYMNDLGITNFDYAVDWGYFWFLTHPIFKVLDFFNHEIGNFGLSILLLTVLIKLAFFPLANKSYRAMGKMKLLQPEMVKLREKFGEDKARLNQEMMALYKRTGANPMAGCLPIFIQIPVFFSLYKVLFVTIEMRHAPFYGWVHDLSAQDPTSIFNLFGLIPFTPPHVLMIGAWPLIMGVTMFLQQKLNPQPADPVQAKMFMFLPIVFTYMLASFPAGLVIYWAWNNTLSILQQWVIMRRAAKT